MNRRSVLLGAGSMILLGSGSVRANATADRHLVKVALSPTCGCCKAWVTHLK